MYGDHPAIPAEYREELGKLPGMKIASSLDWKNGQGPPKLFRIPGKERITGTSDIDTGQMDILPTVAGLMGLIYGRYSGRTSLPQITRSLSCSVTGPMS